MQSHGLIANKRWVNRGLEERNKILKYSFGEAEHAGKTQKCGPRVLRTELKLETIKRAQL